MQSFDGPLCRLQDELVYFVREPQLRVLHIATSAELHRGVVDLCLVQELHADNRAPWFALFDPHTPSDEGWRARSARVREVHRDRLAQIEAEGEAVVGLGELSPSDGLDGFVAELLAVQRARAAWHAGAVVVLAPTRVDDASAWRDALTRLVACRELPTVRWVFVDIDHHASVELAAGLGRRAHRVSCYVDEAEAARELEDRLARMQACGESAPPYAKTGAAWPRGIEAPPVPGRPVASPEQALAAGLPAAAVHGFALAKQVTAAAAALRRGEGGRAVDEQARACALAERAGMDGEALVLRLVLAAYQVHAGRAEQALGEFETVAERAAGLDRPELAVQAWMGVGAVHAAARQPGAAARAYGYAAELGLGIEGAQEQAPQGNAHRLTTIEALRLSGQHYLEVGEVEASSHQWLRAVELGEQAATAEAQGSAAEAGFALAELCRRQGLTAQADSLTASIERWRATQAPTPASTPEPTRASTPGSAPAPTPGSMR